MIERKVDHELPLLARATMIGRLDAHARDAWMPRRLPKRSDFPSGKLMRVLLFEKV